MRETPRLALTELELDDDLSLSLSLGGLNRNFAALEGQSSSALGWG